MFRVKGGTYRSCRRFIDRVMYGSLHPLYRQKRPTPYVLGQRTNFIGSRNEIDALQSALAKTRGSESLPNKFAATGMDFHIPPRAPHFGGWEAAVKSSKLHLKKVFGSSVVTFEELSTIFCQIRQS